MGYFEEQNQKRIRSHNTKALVLGAAALAGGIAVALIAPNVLGAMGKLGLIPKQRGKEYVYAARQRLKKQGLLIEQNGLARLTAKGEKALLRLSLALALPREKRKWDGKWRVLIFDVPERRRKARVHIRTMLRSAGFERIQDSVWLYPYPCEEYVALLKADAHIGRDLLYMIVDSLEGDARFRTIFELPQSQNTPPPLKLPSIVETVLEPLLPLKK
jgi:CRISPR/Cas system-associated endoribonuclease Cas2